MCCDLDSCKKKVDPSVDPISKPAAERLRLRGEFATVMGGRERPFLDACLDTIVPGACSLQGLLLQQRSLQCLKSGFFCLSNQLIGVGGAIRNDSFLGQLLPGGNRP